mmetsp:Transcript_7974/g.15332  ORF Transcript_7974/g.15332 Transcript_7974/m.15332 type:complete len:201 (-) Transcript_7974:4267-4869(-)
MVPPGGVGDELQLLVGLPGHQLESPGAIGVARAVGLFLVLELLRLLAFVLDHPVLAEHADIGQVAKQHGLGRVEQQVDRVVIDLAHLLDAGDEDGHLAGGMTDARERLDHIVGAEGLALVKLHATAQLETDLGRAEGRPLGGEGGLDLELLGVAHQALVGIAGQRRGGAMVGSVRVQRQDVVLRRPAQRVGGGGVQDQRT